MCVLVINQRHLHYLMGNFPSTHVKIWNELSLIENETTKMKMIDTLFNVPEYVKSFKTAGLYSDIVTWIAVLKRGQWAPFPKYVPPAPSSTALTKQAPAKRAMDYLHEAYDLLGLSDDEPLTMEGLKTAYKKRAVSCHPDKGGNPEVFDALTKAYLYLQEVYKKLVPKGLRPDTNAASVTMESAVKYRNDPSLPSYDENNSISMVVHEEKPVRAYDTTVRTYDTTARAYDKEKPLHINPKKLDMNVFNQLFEQNRLPDPEKDDGYGDWLKTQDAVKKSGPNLRGKFNLDVFNNTFESEAREQDKKAGSTITKYDSPDALMLTPTAVVLGGEKPSEYTAPAGSRVQYTDLKAVYSTRMTFSQEVGDVKVGKKSYDQVKAEREKDPGPTTAEEAARISEMAKKAEQMERGRQLRLAARDTDVTAYHDRIKQRLLISDPPLQ